MQDESLRLCPAMYQECITGTKHIRATCFGGLTYAALIETEDLDWRLNYAAPMHPWTVPPELHARLHTVLKMLDLEMGIFDLKLDQDGSPVWLEVNPQGQFLFVEGITGLPLTRVFAGFLVSRASGS